MEPIKDSELTAQDGVLGTYECNYTGTNEKTILGLYGPENSMFLRLVERRAKAKGIKTAWVAGPTPGCAAYVDDTDAGWPLWEMSHEEDVDNITHTGLSCCAAGALKCSEHVPGWAVLIIGRGHAVQGLADAMMAQGYMVNQCSSTALDMSYRVARAEIIINSAREVSEEVLKAVNRNTSILDISGSMEPLARMPGYLPKGCIGTWNVDELLYRVKERIKEVNRDA